MAARPAPEAETALAAPVNWAAEALGLVAEPVPAAAPAAWVVVPLE